jgi:hypothetical protein
MSFSIGSTGNQVTLPNSATVPAQEGQPTNGPSENAADQPLQARTALATQARYTSKSQADQKDRKSANTSSSSTQKSARGASATPNRKQ